MNVREWILLLCVLLTLSCAKRQGDTKTTGGKPGADKPAAEATTPVAPTASQQATAAPSRPSKLGDAAWPLTGLTWVKGGPVEIKPGTVYVVEFWATWCPPCGTSIPHLTELQYKYKDKNLVVIGISDEKVTVVTPFVEQKGAEMDYAVAVDATGRVAEGYMGVFEPAGRIPTAFVVGADGKLVWFGHPMVMDAVLEKILAGASATQGG